MTWRLGVDIGGTNLAAGLVSKDGVIAHKASVPTSRGGDPVRIVEDIAHLCKDILEQTGTSPADVVSLGMGLPGAYDNGAGVIIFTPNLPFRNTPARELLTPHFPFPILLGNDANCAALGEATSGAAKGCSSSITVTLGTGVGGGIIVNGRIYEGAFGTAGEVGHQVIVADGELCGCGRKGCWEAYASASALIREATKAAKDNHSSALYSLAEKESITGKAVFDAAHAGDATAKTVIHQYIQALACGLVNLINILQPEMVVLGGGICAQGDALLIPLKEAVEAQVYGGVLKTRLAVATLGNDAGIIGAAMLG